MLEPPLRLHVMLNTEINIARFQIVFSVLVVFDRVHLATLTMIEQLFASPRATTSLQIVPDADIQCCTRCFSTCNKQKTCQEAAMMLYRLDMADVASIFAVGTQSQRDAAIAAMRGRDYMLRGLAGDGFEGLVESPYSDT